MYFYLYFFYSQMKDLSTSIGKSWKGKDKAIVKKPSTENKKQSKGIKDATWKIRDNVFKIKIADLLNETGRQDELSFEHKFSDQLPNLDDEGISGNFTIQSLDATSLLGTLTDVSACFHETCDSCGAWFLRSVHVPLYTARFVFEDEVKKKEAPESEEVLLFIDSKAETINIEDMVAQAILLDDPFVKRCDACTKRLANVSDDDDLDEFQAKGNIIFS